MCVLLPFFFAKKPREINAFRLIKKIRTNDSIFTEKSSPKSDFTQDYSLGKDFVSRKMHSLGKNFISRKNAIQFCSPFHLT